MAMVKLQLGWNAIIQTEFEQYFYHAEILYDERVQYLKISIDRDKVYIAYAEMKQKYKTPNKFEIS